MENCRYRKCVICGIRKLPKSRTLLASFPLDPDRCRLWVKASGIEDFIHVPIEKLHELKYVCGSHFAPECFNAKGNRLLSSAVPTLRLNRPLLSDDLFTEFPLHVKSYYAKFEKGESSKRRQTKIVPVETIPKVTKDCEALNISGTATENVVSPLLDAEISPTSSHYEIDFSNSTVVQPGEMAQWDTKGKTFLITGGASGLGAQYAQAFLEHGAKNVAILDIAEELGAATAERLNAAHGNKAVFIKCDVSKEEDIARAFDAVLAHFKQIDVIINNAGVMVDSPTVWRTASDINWQGVVSFTLKGVKHMRKDEGGVGGTIINIASIMAITKFPYLPIYCGSKMAVVQFSQCLAMDPFYEDTGVRVMSMCLGATDTPLLQNLAARVWDPKHGKEMADAIEKGYIYQTRESAAAALLDMFRKGPPASIWMSVDNKPVKNITASIDRAFKDFENVIAGLND